MDPLQSLTDLAPWQQVNLENMVDGMTNLEEEADMLLAERREHALTSRGGTAELIACAVDHLEVKYKEGRGENSNLPRSRMVRMRTRTSPGSGLGMTRVMRTARQRASRTGQAGEDGCGTFVPPPSCNRI